MSETKMYHCLRCHRENVGYGLDGGYCGFCRGPLMPLTSKEQKSKLLVIELDEYGSVPRVFYRGEEIKKKIKVLFDWRTKDEKHSGLSNIEIEYADHENDLPVCKAIKLSNPFKESEQDAFNYACGLDLSQAEDFTCLEILPGSGRRTRRTLIQIYKTKLGHLFKRKDLW